MIGDVIEAVKLLANGVNALRGLSSERRLRFARHCDYISDVLKKYIETKEDQMQSINLCAELRQYVEPIREVGRGTLASADIERLATELNRVCDAFQELASRTDETAKHSYEGELAQLWDGVGQFRGLANRLRG